MLKYFGCRVDWDSGFLFVLIKDSEVFLLGIEPEATARLLIVINEYINRRILITTFLLFNNVMFGVLKLIINVTH
jgi:hypothetical protein